MDRPRAGKLALDPDGWPYLLLLGALCALPPLSIDMALPALTATQQALHSSASLAGLTLTLFMAGFAATPLAYGILSDHRGRKPLLLVGLALFVIGGLASAFAPSMGALLAARFVQGAGAGVGPTLAFAATRDRLEGLRMNRRISALTVLLAIAPVIAPSLGAIMLGLAGWRAIFLALAIGGGVLFVIVLVGFEESLPDAGAPHSRPRLHLLDSIRRLAGSASTLEYGVVGGLAFGSMFAYVAGSPLVLIGSFKASALLYAWLFAATALGIMIGAVLAGRLAHRMRARTIAMMGLGLALCGPIVVILLLLGKMATLPFVMPFLVVATFGFGLVAPTASHAALEPVPEMAGFASAFLNSFQMGCMSLSSLLVALLLPAAGAAAMPAVMILFAAAAGAVLLFPRGARKRAVARGD
jgi:DHA1 family bicyclomycin/chloramphenicol resistance-like MFS transporter